jgi:hypothetical protein
MANVVLRRLKVVQTSDGVIDPVSLVSSSLSNKAIDIPVRMLTSNTVPAAINMTCNNCTINYNFQK